MSVFWSQLVCGFLIVFFFLLVLLHLFMTRFSCGAFSFPISMFLLLFRLFMLLFNKYCFGLFAGLI